MTCAKFVKMTSYEVKPVKLMKEENTILWMMEAGMSFWDISHYTVFILEDRSGWASGTVSSLSPVGDSRSNPTLHQGHFFAAVLPTTVEGIGQ